MKHELIRKIYKKEEEKTPTPKKPARIGGKIVTPEPMIEGKALNHKYLSYEHAKLVLLDMPDIRSRKTYEKARKERNLIFLSPNPVYTYADEWNGWADYLGIDSFRRKPHSVMPYFEAKSIVQYLVKKYKILDDSNCLRGWLKFCDDQHKLPKEERELPDSIPRLPNAYYDEFEGYPTFLGKKLADKLINAQQQKKIEQREADEIEIKISKYNGQPVYAITTGIDPFNNNVIKVVVSYQGLSDLIAICDSLQYNIISAYLYNQTEMADIINCLDVNGTDNGDSCYTIHNMNALLSGLEFASEQLSDALLYSYKN